MSRENWIRGQLLAARSLGMMARVKDMPNAAASQAGLPERDASRHYGTPKMLGLIDLPSPFAPLEDLRASLAMLATLPQDDPDVRESQGIVASYLREAERREPAASVKNDAT